MSEEILQGYFRRVKNPDNSVAVLENGLDRPDANQCTKAWNPHGCSQHDTEIRMDDAALIKPDKGYGERPQIGKTAITGSFPS
ncbi:MAG: hypothetical protein GX325_09500 [Peptococcaceae bacterium]|nr:hypothetical protein [Peptococcaceae bacterium]